MVSKAYDRMKEGLTEALSVARGDQPAASIHLNGHTYVPKADYDRLMEDAKGERSVSAALNGMNRRLKADLDEALRRYDERNRTAQDRAVSNGLKLERIAKLESELAGCKIALEQAWESNRERQAEIERLVRNAQTEAWLLAGYHRICERHGIAPSSAELIVAAKEVENEGRA